MNNVAIRVEHIGKSYTIVRNRSRSRYQTLQEDLLVWPRAALARIRGAKRAAHGSYETFWALDDVSFDVMEGEVLGIIGRNGAGKSTMLKILSRITEPSRGRAEVYGRVGALLEVGTGFHPELTGRENVFLNGAILGMRRSEIAAHFDEIVEFAEVNQFIDTPVKHYSSGMFMRLAFAVAAHLEPEILVVDEVLAVGDAAFQKKCMGKMGEVAKGGRTVLFVSHNMAAVQQLCQRGLVLQHGHKTFLGDVSAAVAHYTQMGEVQPVENLAERKDRQGTQILKFMRVAFFDDQGKELSQLLSGQNVSVRLYYRADRTWTSAAVNIAFNVRSAQGYLLCNLNSVDTGQSMMAVHAEGFFQCTWKNFNLRRGIYDCSLFCSINGDVVDWMQSAFKLRVDDGDFYKTGKLIGREQGDVLVVHQWASGAA